VSSLDEASAPRTETKYYMFKEKEKKRKKKTKPVEPFHR
jgi:hypothetical protein